MPGIAYVDCGGVVPNPRLELAEEAVELVNARVLTSFWLSAAGLSWIPLRLLHMA